MKRLDPYHIMYSPITGRTLGQAWRYQAASGKRNGQPAQLTKRPAQLTKRGPFFQGRHGVAPLRSMCSRSSTMSCRWLVAG
jgi:hypothetical protein